MQLPPKEEVERLKLSPEIAWYLTSRGYSLPECPPKIKTPEPRDAGGAYFDPERVDRVVDVFRRLRHTQGKWSGRPIELRAWQIAYLIGPTYGWVRKNADGIVVRIIRAQYLDIPRKNAKTTIGGGQCIYLTCADGEPGAQVFALASRKDQARFCFDPVRQLATQAPDLKGHVKPLRDRIIHQRTGSYFAVMSSAGDAMHGASPHAAFVDEVHVHKTRDLMDAVESGTGARAQPLIMYATTADEGTPHTPYTLLRQYCEQIAAGTVRDESFYGVVFGVEESDDPFVEETWLRANPGCAAGDSPTLEFLQAEATKAQQSPAHLARFQRLHLGIRTKQSSRFFTLAEWDRSAGMVRPDQLVGATAYGGLDLGSTSDLTSLCWVFPRAPGHDVLWRFWVPEARIQDLDRRTAGSASVWVRQGWLHTTDGNVTDYEAVKAQILRDLGEFQVLELAYDPWNATDLVNRLVAEGAPMVQVRQGYGSLSAPLKEVKRLLAESTTAQPMLRHGGNPVARWMVDNLAVAMDAAGNVKPDKANASEKIDGVSALVTAMARAMHHQPPRRSAYESGGLVVV